MACNPPQAIFLPVLDLSICDYNRTKGRHLLKNRTKGRHLLKNELGPGARLWR